MMEMERSPFLPLPEGMVIGQVEITATQLTVEVISTQPSACQEWRLLHLTAVPAIERDEWVARYFEILAAGFAAQPPPPASSAGSRQG
jgi:hypothetical protein